MEGEKNHIQLINFDNIVEVNTSKPMSNGRFLTDEKF